MTVMPHEGWDTEVPTAARITAGAAIPKLIALLFATLFELAIQHDVLTFEILQVLNEHADPDLLPAARERYDEIRQLVLRTRE